MELGAKSGDAEAGSCPYRRNAAEKGLRGASHNLTAEQKGLGRGFLWPERGNVGHRDLNRGCADKYLQARSTPAPHFSISFSGGGEMPTSHQLLFAPQPALTQRYSLAAVYAGYKNDYRFTYKTLPLHSFMCAYALSAPIWVALDVSAGPVLPALYQH